MGEHASPHLHFTGTHPGSTTALVSKATWTTPEQFTDVKVTITDSETVVTTTPQTGEVETRFFIVHPVIRHMPQWSEGHPTQAAAIEALASVTNTTMGRVTGEGDYEVISMTRMASGAPLVAVNVAVKITATIEYTPRRLVAPATVGTTRIGWALMGCAVT